MLNDLLAHSLEVFDALSNVLPLLNLYRWACLFVGSNVCLLLISLTRPA